MSLTLLIVSVVIVLIGLAFCAAGYPLFLVLLPVWAFVASFIATADAVSQAFGSTFLADAAGIGLGVIVGALVAIIAVAAWWTGVILLGVTIGYMIGAGIADWIGFGGFITFIAGMVVAAVFGVGFFVLRAPRLSVMVVTAAAGAVMAVAGLMLLFNQTSTDELKAGVLAVVLHSGPIAYILALVLAVAGTAFQFRFAQGTEVKLWRQATGEGPA